MNSRPLVSVYIPTHNRCKLLKRAVQSVFAQDYSRLELLIVDDASQDETQTFLSQLTHPYVQLKTFRLDSPKGACAARNLAISHANGKFVTGLDDDDEFLPHRISQLVKEYDPSFAFICAGFLWNYGKLSRKVDSSPMHINLAEQLNYNYATNQVLVEAQRIKAIGGFDENIVACQDYDTWTRLIAEYGPAKRMTGVSYIIHRDADISRISSPKNWLVGHAQFMAKHQDKMSPINKLNQEFRRIIAKREPLPFSVMLRQLKAGLIKQKLRYFLSSNFRQLAKLRLRFISK